MKQKIRSAVLGIVLCVLSTFGEAQTRIPTASLAEVGSHSDKGHARSKLTEPQGGAPLALSFKNHLMTKDPLKDSDCQTPIGTGVFFNSDSTAWLWFSVSGAQKGDTAKAEWMDPDNVVYYTVQWDPTTWEGDGCFWAGILVADRSPSSRLGNWSVKVSYNGAVQFTETFRIVQPTDVKVTVKNRMMTKDALPNSGCRTPQPASNFLTTDQAAWVWFSVSGIQPGDRVTTDWLAPDNTLYFRFVGNPATGSGGRHRFRSFGESGYC